MKFDADKFQSVIQQEISALIDNFDETVLKPRMQDIARNWVSRRAGRKYNKPLWGPKVSNQIKEFLKEDS